MLFLPQPVLYAGDGVEHQPGERDHPSHQYEAAVVAAALVEYCPHDWGPDEGGHTLEEKEETECVGELVRPQQVSQHQGRQQDIGSARVNISQVVGGETFRISHNFSL